VLEGTRVVAEKGLRLTPAESVRLDFPGLPRAPRYTVEVRDDAGRVILTHTEDRFDMAPASEITVGPMTTALPLAVRAQTAGFEACRSGDVSFPEHPPEEGTGLCMASA